MRKSNAAMAAEEAIDCAALRLQRGPGDDDLEASRRLWQAVIIQAVDDARAEAQPSWGAADYQVRRGAWDWLVQPSEARDVVYACAGFDGRLAGLVAARLKRQPRPVEQRATLAQAA